MEVIIRFRESFYNVHMCQITMMKKILSKTTKMYFWVSFNFIYHLYLNKGFPGVSGKESTC